MHLVLLTFQSFFILIISFPVNWVSNAQFSKTENFGLPFTDLTVQLIICYICYT